MEPATQPAIKTGADIANQTYKGPGAAVTSLGYGFIDFKIATAASLILGIGAAKFAPKHTTALLNGMGTSAARWKQGNIAQKAGGHVLDAWVKTGNWFAHHIPFSEWLSKNLKDWEPIARTSGMLGVLGSVITTFSGTARGIGESRAGRDQFNEAKQAIHDLRTENDMLRQRYTQHKLAADPELALAAAAEIPPQPATRIDAETITHTPPATQTLERN